jgi:hypothetical protein
VTAAGYLRSLSAGGVQYFEAVIQPAGSNNKSAVEIPLPSGQRILVWKRPVSPLLPVDAALFADLSLQSYLPEELLLFERIPAGLADYF